MKKLKLNLDEIKVESFEISPKDGIKIGTVNGYVTWTELPLTQCGCPTAIAGGTCMVSCEIATCPEIICRPSIDSCDTCLDLTCVIEYCE